MATDAAQYNLVRSHLLRLEALFLNRLCDSSPAVPKSQDTATILHESGHRKETAGRALFAPCGFVFFGPEQVLRPVRIQIDPHLEVSLVNEALCTLSDLGETLYEPHSTTISTSIGSIELEKRLQLDWSFEKSTSFKRDIFYVLKDADFDLMIGKDILDSSTEPTKKTSLGHMMPHASTTFPNNKNSLSSPQTFSAEYDIASPQLEQFVRGIANHLIDEYEPKHSVVISPLKMQKFYRDYSIRDDLYPWQTIFDDTTSAISPMLRALGVQHFLTHNESSGLLEIPALTVRGFEAWAWLFISAHPDIEYERLSMVAQSMPINSTDEAMTGSLLRELDQCLLLKQPNPHLCGKIQAAVSACCGVLSNTSHESPPIAPLQPSPTPEWMYPQDPVPQDPVDQDQPTGYFPVPASRFRRWAARLSRGSILRQPPDGRVHGIQPRTSDEVLITHLPPMPSNYTSPAYVGDSYARASRADATRSGNAWADLNRQNDFDELDGPLYAAPRSTGYP